MKKHQLITRIAFLIFIFSTPILQAETIRYISDDLTIPMRSGTTNRHKILKFLNSGMPVKVLETTEDGLYSYISIEGDKEGWVETNKLMSTKSAKDQLVINNQKLETSEKKIKELRSIIANLKTDNKRLESELASTTEQKNTLRQTLTEFKTSAAKPIAIYEKNKQLENDINQLTNENKSLISENAQLNDDSLKKWFIIGAAVALGSLVLGMIIPNIRWRKKDSWGGSF